MDYWKDVPGINGLEEKSKDEITASKLSDMLQKVREKATKLENRNLQKKIWNKIGDILIDLALL